MNWLEFVAEAESTMRDKGIDPASVTVRVEVSDSYYDHDVTPDRVVVTEYGDGPGTELRPYLVIWGD